MTYPAGALSLSAFMMAGDTLAASSSSSNVSRRHHRARGRNIDAIPSARAFVRNPPPESDIAAAAATSDTGAQSAAAGFLADLCRRTNGGVDATREDIEAARRIAYELLERHTITARDAAGTGITPGTVTEAARRETEKLVGTKWCMVGCVQRTLPSPASWLAGSEGGKHESNPRTQSPKP
jgi:hypothetical protein